MLVKIGNIMFYLGSDFIGPFSACLSAEESPQGLVTRRKMLAKKSNFLMITNSLVILTKNYKKKNPGCLCEIKCRNVNILWFLL